MKITQTSTPEEFSKLTRPDFHQLWFNEALTDKQMAKMFRVDVAEVKRKRKALGLNWFSSAMLFLAGGNLYKDNRKARRSK